MKDALPISLKDTETTLTQIENKINNKQGIPDYDNTVLLGDVQTYTASKAGIVFLGTSGTIKINGYTVMNLQEAHAMTIPLDVGDTISIPGRLQSFVPFK